MDTQKGDNTPLEESNAKAPDLSQSLQKRSRAIDGTVGAAKAMASQLDLDLFGFQEQFDTVGDLIDPAR